MSISRKIIWGVVSAILILLAWVSVNYFSFTRNHPQCTEWGTNINFLTDGVAFECGAAGAGAPMDIVRLNLNVFTGNTTEGVIRVN